MKFRITEAQTDFNDSGDLKSKRNTLHLVAIFAFHCVVLIACATYNPRPIHEVPFQERSQTKVKDNVRVTAAVLSAEESRQVFDLDLYKKGIQPIRLEIENNTEARIWFPEVGVDPNYFTPHEVAYMHRRTFSKKVNQEMEQYLHGQAVGGHVSPGNVRSGFVFTNLDIGTKVFNVDLLGEDKRIRTFAFLIPVPGLRVDYREVNWDNLYTKEARVAYDNMDDLREALSGLPCCTTNKDATKMGDPVNVVIIGAGRNVLYSLRRSGWDETAAITTGKTESPATSPWEVRYTPVKPLYLLGRHQDAAFRKTRATINERNQLRLWLSPMVFKGENVWVGQVSRIIRRFASEKFKIEPDVDEARGYLMQNLWLSQGLLRYGFVKGMEVTTISKPRKSLYDDNYFTDGYRLVIWVADEPVAFSEVEFVGWRIPFEERRKRLIGQ